MLMLFEIQSRLSIVNIIIIQGQVQTMSRCGGSPMVLSFSLFTTPSAPLESLP